MDTFAPPWRAVVISLLSTVDGFEGAVYGFTNPPVVVPVELIVIAPGSRSQVPALPFSAEALTVPLTWRLSALDVSINPPLPPAEPALAEMFP
jgi:hypothetical protein